MEGEKYKIEEILAEQGVYVGPTVGVSMLPMLKNRRDTIVVRPKMERLKPLDVALYKRGDAYVLHRVLTPVEGGYIIRGDNCDQKEYGITDEQVLGVLVEFYRGNRKVSLDSWMYKAYVNCYCACTPIWWTVRTGRRVLVKIVQAFKRREKKTCA